ncbi:MAG: DUF3991 domain-containing protein [Ruminococcus flavefaciens]|nr:DUF3991 domain-containing protein [Ruminococcus flavefaciens]MCM1059271.1 DUF3991 domain-containing protein [Eubacterium sp.]
MPKYTDEQVERAKNTDVRTFLEQTEGYTFQKSGKYLKCQNPERTGQPSSLTVDTNMNRIFYNSETGNRPLSALDWCKEIKKLDFQSSMQLILGENPQGERAEKPKYQQHRSEPVNNEPKSLELSEKSDTSKNVYAYLTKTRGIPENIVKDCLNKNLIYQDVRKNAVFVGYDNDNNAKYAARRGTFTPDGKEPFKRDCTGSDKNFAFRLEGKNTDTIYVAEAAIDALSLAALEDKFHGSGAYKEKTYISTGGAGIDSAVEQFCKTHDVKTINICFDNDEAGKNGMEKIMQQFREQGYEVNDMRASQAHDYNDELLAFNQNPQFYPEPPLTVRTAAENVRTEKTENIQPPEATENYPEPPINEADIPPEDYYAYYGEPDIPPEDYYNSYEQYEEEIPPMPEPIQEERIDTMPEISVTENTQPEEKKTKEVEQPVMEEIKTVPEQPQTRIVEMAESVNKPKKEEVILPKREAVPPIQTTESTEKKQEINSVSSQPERKVEFTEKQLENLDTEGKMNFLLASMKDRQENKRAELLDKIDRIDSKIADRQGRIDKLNNKIADIETSLKTSAAFKRAFGNTPIGKLIDNSIEKKQAKIQKIRETKIPKHKEKLDRQTDKKAKSVKRLGKVNRKINKIDKVQGFFTAIGSDNREERHKGFVNGLESLSNIRRESLENKLHKTETKIDMLSAKYSSPDISHTERYEIGKNIRSLRAKSTVLSDKIENMNKLHSDLDDIKNGKFTEAEIETVVNKTADKISERFEKSDNQEKGIINTVIANSVESGSEAINEVTAEKAIEQAEKSKPSIERERTPEEREPDVNKTKELDILTMAAVITGVNISELNRLPAEIKADIVAEFQENNGNISSEQLAERICEIADIEPPEAVKPSEPEIKPQKNKEKENPLREIEEMTELNYNHIDGIINNLPPEKPKEIEPEKDEPLFSRSKIMGDDFKPTSEKSQEDKEKSKNKNSHIEL